MWMKVSGMGAFLALTEIIMLNEEHNVRNGQPSYGLLVRQSTDTLRMVKVIAIAACCVPKLDNKTLFLKMPHPLVSGHREIKLGTSSKLSSY